MFDLNQQRKQRNAFGTAGVFGVGVAGHRSGASRTRLSDIVGGWYGTELRAATPPNRLSSGAESRS